MRAPDTFERQSPRAWTVAEAKARLSEVLRRSADEGPQRIGARKQFVVVPAEVWEEKNGTRQSLGEWLIANAPGGGPLDLPPRDEEAPERPGAFHDWTEDDWRRFDRRDPGRETNG